MKKYLLIGLLVISLNAEIVDKIVASVNNEPITSYDIQIVMKKLHSDKNKALNFLIDQKIIDSEIKKRNISVDDFDINNALEKIAKQNNLSLFEFKNILEQKGELEKAKKEIKNNLLKQKLFGQIINAKLRISPDEIKEYYENNKNNFAVFNTVRLIRYSSNNPKILKKLFNNPYYTDKSILVQTQVYNSDNLSLNKMYLFKNTKIGQFTPIINEGLSYVTYYISDKEGEKYLSFKKVKNVIINQLAAQKRNRILKEYFDKLKNRADIKVYN